MRSIEKINLYAIYNPKTDRFVGQKLCGKRRRIVYTNVRFGAALKFERKSLARAHLKYLTRKEAKEFSDFSGSKILRIVKVRERIITFSIKD